MGPTGHRDVDRARRRRRVAGQRGELGGPRPAWPATRAGPAAPGWPNGRSASVRPARRSARCALLVVGGEPTELVLDTAAAVGAEVVARSPPTATCGRRRARRRRDRARHRTAHRRRPRRARRRRRRGVRADRHRAGQGALPRRRSHRPGRVDAARGRGARRPPAVHADRDDPDRLLAELASPAARPSPPGSCCARPAGARRSCSTARSRGRGADRLRGAAARGALVGGGRSRPRSAARDRADPARPANRSSASAPVWATGWPGCSPCRCCAPRAPRFGGRSG